MGSRAWDSVDLRVASILYDGFARAHDLPRPEPEEHVCACGHSDDQHFGHDGELHCSVCGCGAFEAVAA